MLSSSQTHEQAPPIRVVFLWDDIFRPADGVNRFLCHCLEGLHQYEIDPFVVTLKSQSVHKDALADQYRDRIIECQPPWPGSPNVNEARGPLSRVAWLYRHMRRFYSQFQQWRFGSRILWNIARIRPDIVVFSEWYRLELSRLLQPHCAVIGVWHTCKTTDGYFESAAEYGDALDALVGVSEATSTNLAKYGGQKLQDKINTIVYGVGHQGDPYPKRDFTGASPIKIAYLGRFEESQKRISDVLKIIANLRDRGCLFRMTLAGEGPDYIKTQRQFETLGIPTNFLGVLEPAEALRFWEEQDIMLLVSRHEGTPLSLLEAMSKGCVPVVSKSSGGVTEVVNNGTSGLTFDVGDIEGASSQLYRLCQDRSLLERLSVQAYELSHMYPVEDMLRQYEALFHQVTAEKRGSWSARNYLSLAGQQAKTLFD